MSFVLTTNTNRGIGARKLKIQKNGVDIATFSANELEVDDDLPVTANIVVPTNLSDLSDDATHRLVSDTEKAAWDAKASTDIVSTTANGLAPMVTSTSKYLRGDGVWATPTNTKNTAGSTDSSDKLFLIGATSQAASPQTYSQDTAYVGTDGHLYSNSKQTVNLSDTQALTNKTYNGYTLGSACAKNVPSSGNASTSQVVMGNDSRLSDSRPASDVSAWAKASTKPSYTASEVNAVSTEANQGLTDTQKSNARANIGAGTSSLTLGTSSSTAFRGDYGNSAYVHAVTNKGSAFTNGLYKITTNSEGHVTAATAVAKADITALGIPDSDTNNRKAFFGTCDTAGDTAAKVVTLSDTTGWELKAGTIVGVKFTNKNTASSVTLNVNGSGAKSIWYNTAVYTDSSANVCGAASMVIYYMYDGTNWVWLNMGKLDGNTDTKVRQTLSTTNKNYPLLLSYAESSNTTGNVDNVSYRANAIYANPSTGNLQATQLNGVTIGSSPKFTDTNTWRGIQDNLTSSTNTTESLSAKQGYLLANGSARDSTKVMIRGNAGKSNMNDIGKLTASTGMTNLTDPGNNYDNPLSGTTKSTGWHYYWDTSYSDDPSGSNSWVSQICNKAGTAQWWVRSRSGGAITNGTAWHSPWKHLAVAPQTGQGNATTPTYVDSDGQVQSCSSIYADFIKNRGYFDITSYGTLIPFLMNDIAFLTAKGGSYSIKYDGTAQTVNLDPLFDCRMDTNLNVPSATSYSNIVIELTLHKAFYWGSNVYISFFGNSTRSNAVKLEVMNSDYTGDTWTQKYNTTNNTESYVRSYITHTPVGAGNAGAGFNKMRFTFSDFPYSTFRILQIGLFNDYTKGFSENLLNSGTNNLLYGGGITPSAGYTCNLGTSGSYFKDAYLYNLHTNNINGVVEKWQQITTTLSTTNTTTYTFTNSDIHTNSQVDVYASIFGVNPTSVTVAEGSCTVIFPKYTSAASMTCRIWIRNVS